MNKIIKIVAFFLICSTTTGVIAQNLPKPSPKAKLEQRIGLTDIAVEYSRPSTKGRVIFGDLVPYDKIWRAGANKNSLITFNDHVKIEGEKVEAGTYSIFIIPSEKKSKWTLILNSVIDGWGDGKYDSINNVVTLLVEPKTIEKQETMQFSFDNLKANTGDLKMSWADKSISVKIEVEVESKAWEYIDVAIRDANDKNSASVYRNSAKYTVTTNKRLDDGLKWINESISKQEYWYSYWVKADVQHAMGDNAGAIKSANKAIELGEAGAKESGKPFGYKDRLEAAIANYK